MIVEAVTVPVKVGLERVTEGIGLGKYGVLMVVVPVVAQIDRLGA